MSRAIDEDSNPTMLQRIAERRTKLEAKIKAKRAGQSVEGGIKMDDNEQREGGGGEEEIRASRRRLQILKGTASEAVTRFRVITDVEENDRRMKEEKVQEENEGKIKEKKNQAHDKQGAIQMKFDDLEEMKIPHDLHQELELQKKSCEEVIEIKDTLISEFRTQMRAKEEEYVNSLKKQAEDIEQLLATMHTQTDTVVNAYTDELLSVERAFEEERRQLLQSNEAEIEQLVKSRAKLEGDYNRSREKRVSDDQSVLDAKYEENSEKYNQCKMQYQHNIHGLAQELERMRALYLLNAQRLSYNLRVLHERLLEHAKNSEQHKRKTARLQDVLSGLISKYTETDKRFRQANNELTLSYRRVTEQYKDLQRKFQHFEKADAEKYRQVWAMHEGDCMQLVHRCLQGDRVVFEELLGINWVPPSLDFWLHVHTNETERLKDEEENAQNDEAIELTETARAMLQVCYSQVPFLVEERTRIAISTMADPVEAQALQVETVLSALNIRKTEEVTNLLDFFLTESDDGTTTFITSQQAVQALQRFMEERRQAQMASKDADTSKEETAVGAATTKKAKEVEKRKQEKIFWERMSSVVPDSHLRVWQSLEGGLNQYLSQLQGRQAMIQKTDAIRKQNDELRALLNQYLGSRLNEELFAPPQLQVLPTTAGN